MVPSFSESPVVFRIDDDELLGIVSTPTAKRSNIGLLIVVGGPQYRIGSHRQFVQMCRAAAQSGITAFRFDVRGMGDSSGASRSFEDVGSDITRAVDFFTKQAGLSGVVLWGLCDGASAIAITATNDDQVKGLVLVNPWVHEESLKHKAFVETYYRNQIFNPATYRRLFRGDIDVVRALRNFLGSLKIAYIHHPEKAQDENHSLLDRVTAGIVNNNANKLVVLSGEDLTAKEFEVGCSAKFGTSWRQRLCAQVLHIASANHTFSYPQHRHEIERATIDFIVALEQ